MLLAITPELGQVGWPIMNNMASTPLIPHEPPHPVQVINFGLIACYLD